MMNNPNTSHDDDASWRTSPESPHSVTGSLLPLPPPPPHLKGPHGSPMSNNANKTHYASWRTESPHSVTGSLLPLPPPPPHLKGPHGSPMSNNANKTHYASWRTESPHAVTGPLLPHLLRLPQLASTDDNLSRPLRMPRPKPRSPNPTDNESAQTSPDSYFSPLFMEEFPQSGALSHPPPVSPHRLFDEEYNNPNTTDGLEMKNNPNTTHDAVIDSIVDGVLGVLSLRDEAENYLREKYPTLKQFEKFLKLSVEVVKARYKENGKSKEPLFKRSDLEEFILLCRWTKKNQVGGKIEWKKFNEENFNDFREQAPKDDLFEILNVLGIDNDKVKNALKTKSVQIAAHFVQKPKSWYDKLCEEEPGTEENSKQTKQLLLSGAEKSAIEKFKDWYNFHSICYLPSDWIVSFRNYKVHPNERNLRKVLRVVGLNADAIGALKMNGIKDIATLNRTSKEWKTQGASGYSPEQESSRSYEWQKMGLDESDAYHIINFRHWYNFYVAGKKNMIGWTAKFNSAQYNNFLQRYEPGDDFKKPSWWKFWQQDTLNCSQERHDYYDMRQKAEESLESGDVTEEQRYHMLQYMGKREKMSLVEVIASGDSTLEEEERLQELLHRDEQEAYEKDERDLLFGQKFCQSFLSAFLVLTLLGSWLGTTSYFMKQYMRGENDVDGHVIFIHDVLFLLVSMVVKQELGEQATENSLHYRFLPIYHEQRRRQREYRILNRNFWVDIWQFFISSLMCVILWSTKIYTYVWICVGIASLAFGLFIGIDTSNPLYTTGQTWLGVAVTNGKTFFGLNGKNAAKPEDILVQRGSDGANDGEEDGFANEEAIAHITHASPNPDESEVLITPLATIR